MKNKQEEKQQMTHEDIVKYPFNIRISYLRSLNNWTMKELSEKLSVSENSIWSWESGKNYPPIGTVFRIASAFRIPFETLTQNVKKYEERF